MVLGHGNSCASATPRLKIKEIPVEWKSGKDTKVNLFKDSWSMFRQIMKLWWKLKVKHKAKIYRLAIRINALATKDKPPIKIIPAQKTNHSLIIVMLTR